MLPGKNGDEIVRKTRGERTPVLMLSAKDGEYDLADAFDLSADDYSIKPLSFVVLIARRQADPVRNARVQSRYPDAPDAFGIERARLKDARHTCATLMHLRHVPIAVIAAWLDHACAASTLSVYAHRQDDALKATSNSLGRVVTTHDAEIGSQG